MALERLAGSDLQVHRIFILLIMNINAINRHCIAAIVLSVFGVATGCIAPSPYFADGRYLRVQLTTIRLSDVRPEKSPDAEGWLIPIRVVLSHEYDSDLQIERLTVSSLVFAARFYSTTDERTEEWRFQAPQTHLRFISPVEDPIIVPKGKQVEVDVLRPSRSVQLGLANEHLITPEHRPRVPIEFRYLLSGMIDCLLDGKHRRTYAAGFGSVVVTK